MHFLWPKGNGSTAAALNFYIASDAGNSNPNLPNDLSNAVNQWNAGLQNNAPGTLLLTPQISSDSTSPVTMYADSSGDLQLNPNEGGTESFGTITTGQSLSSTNLTSAEIVVGSRIADEDGGSYAAALHEIGHALGLNHSVYQSSIMFPYLSSGCYYQPGSSGVPVQSWDTNYLESAYDPYWAKKDNPIHCSGGHTCAQSKRRIAFASNASESETARTPSTMREYQGTGNTDELGALKLASRAQQVSIHLDDHSLSKEVSLQSMYLGSSLVARLRIVATLGHLDRGAYTVFFRQAQITKIFRHLLGPDENDHIGQLIVLADVQSKKTHFFVDDPPLEDGVQAICFMNQTGRFRDAVYKNVYDMSSKFVSKLGISSDDRLFVAGSTTSKMALQINGLPEPFLEKQILDSDPLAQRAQIIGGNPEQSTLNVLLQRRGYRTISDMKRFRAAMLENSVQVLEFLKAKDSAMAHRAWDVYFERHR